MKGFRRIVYMKGVREYVYSITGCNVTTIFNTSSNKWKDTCAGLDKLSGAKVLHLNLSTATRGFLLDKNII